MSFSIDILKRYLIDSKTDGEMCLMISEKISSYPQLFITRHLLWVSPPLKMGNQKESVKNLSKLINGCGILDASLGPIAQKKLLKFSAIDFYRKKTQGNLQPAVLGIKPHSIFWNL